MPQFNLFKSEQPIGKTACPNCGRAMRLYDIARTRTPGCERLIFSCSECAQHLTALVEYEEVASAS
jgi:RNase P subunit RPR2